MTDQPRRRVDVKDSAVKADVKVQGRDVFAVGVFAALLLDVVVDAVVVVLSVGKSDGFPHAPASDLLSVAKGEV